MADKTALDTANRDRINRAEGRVTRNNPVSVSIYEGVIEVRFEDALMLEVLSSASEVDELIDLLQIAKAEAFGDG